MIVYYICLVQSPCKKLLSTLFARAAKIALGMWIQCVTFYFFGNMEKICIGKQTKKPQENILGNLEEV